MKKKISIAAYLAGVTTLAVSLPAMADQAGAPDGTKAPTSVEAGKLLKTGEKEG